MLNPVSLDIETAPVKGYPQEYALQPWRFNEGKAKINCISVAKASGEAILVTNPNQFRALLKSLAGKEIYTWKGTFDVAWLIAYGFEEECRAIKWRDAMILWKWLDNSQLCERMPKWSLADGVKRFFKDEPWCQPFIDMKHAEVHAGENDQYWETRAKLDAIMTSRVASVVLEKLDARRIKSAMITMSSIFPVAGSWVRGIPIDFDKIEAILPAVTVEMAEIEMRLGCHNDGDNAHLHIGVNGWKPSKVLRSPKQLGELIYGTWGLPVKNRSEKTGAPSTDKAALTYLADDDDLVLEILRWRKLSTQLSKYLQSPLKAREYLGKDTLHPSASIFSTYCVPGDVEVLTRNGWEPLHTWEGGEIAQVEADSCNISFKPATRFIGPNVREWISVKHPKINCQFTPGHTIGYYSQLGKWQAKPAAKAFAEAQICIPLSGKWSGDRHYSAEQSRFICAVHADGYLGPAGTIKFIFKKQRKIDRIRKLLLDLNLPSREYVCAAYPDRTEITIRRKDFPEWLPTECKRLGSWTLELDIPIFLDEIVHWDGSHHADGGVKFGSAKEADVEWVLTLAALDGRKAGRHVPYTNDLGTMYCCHISVQRPIAAIRHKNTEDIIDMQRAYCAKTKTGFWLARSKGKIFVTGNTGRMTYSSKTSRKYQTGLAIHQMPRLKEFRALIKPRPGYKMVEFDASGQESRLMCIHSNDAQMMQIFQNNLDFHSATGARISGLSYEAFMKGKAEGNSAIVGAQGLRYAGKFLNLSQNFRVGAKKMRIQARVQYNIIIDFMKAQGWQTTWKQSYPGVQQYWKDAIAKAKLAGYAETLAGRRFRLIYWGKEDRWSTESSAIMMPIQGSGADQKDLAIQQINKLFPEFEFMIDLHDGLFYEVKQEVTTERILECREMLNNLDYEKWWGFKSPIPLLWDASVGSRWSTLKELD